MTIPFTAACFAGGQSVQSLRVGLQDAPRILRYRFTVPADGASRLSFRLPVTCLSGSPGDAGRLLFALSTDPEAYIRTLPGTGRSLRLEADGCLTGAADMRLSPGADFSLWFYPPGEVSPCLFEPGSLSLTLSGSASRPSSLSAAGTFFGEKVSLSFASVTAGAEHTLSVECAGRRELLLERSAALSASWVPALSVYAPLLPRSDSAEARFTLETFLDGESLGSRSLSLTLRFRPGALAPEGDEGWVSLSPEQDSAAASLTGYIATRSAARAAFDPSKLHFQYGAELQSLSLSWPGGERSAEPWRSGVLTGQTEFVATAADSRGQSLSRRFTVTPMDYRRPLVYDAAARRCLSDGSLSEDGDCLRLNASVSFSSLAGQNAVSLKAIWRSPGGEWSQGVSLTPGTQRIVSGFDPDESLELRFVAEDALGEQGLSIHRIPGRRWAMRFRPDGRGVAFGKSPEFDRALEIPADWEIRRGDSVVPWTIPKQKMYEVGDVYLSTNTTYPTETLGYGYWQELSLGLNGVKAWKRTS